jgi:tetratricopeptide (TPR) repeat protein
LVLALIVAGCAARDPSGIRRLPEPGKVDVAAARDASQAGDWQLAASAWYELYLRGGRTSDVACVEAARALAQLGQFTDAQRLLEDGLQRHPNHPDLLEMLGNVLVEAGFRRAAEPYYERALDVEPSRLSALLALARARTELSLEASAVPLLEKRIALGAGDAETWLLLARAQRAAGNYPRSLEAYDKAFELGESRPDRLVYAASLYFDVDDATRETLDPGRVERWLGRAIELDPQSTRAHELLGRLREAGGDLPGALASYRRAHETDPADRGALRRLWRLQRRRGERELALELARKLLVLESDPERRAEVQRWIDAASAEPEPAPEAGTDGGG